MPTETPTQQMSFDLGHAISFAEDDFVVSDGNRLAYDHIKNPQSWAGGMSLISGPPKSGKSHLALIWVHCADAKLVNAQSNIDLSALESDVPLLLEDVDRAAFDEHWLFHVLNQAMRGQRAVLMTARMPVDTWPYTTADVKSRARQAVHFKVEAANDLLLTHMFVKLLSDRQIKVDLKTIAYLVARMERSAEEAVLLVELLDSLSLSKGRAITRAIASEALKKREILAG